MQRAVALVFKALDALLAALLAGMVLMVLGNVLLRYLFNSGIVASEELSRILFIWLSFIGAVVAVREGTHLGMDTLVARLPPGGRRVCAIASQGLILMCCAMMFWGTWRQHEVNATLSAPVTGLSMIWVFGLGYVCSIGIGLPVLGQLWNLLRGRALAPATPATPAPATPAASPPDAPRAPEPA